MGGCASKGPRPQPLSVEQLLQVRVRLESRKRLTPELKACFDRALSEFAQEPQCIQENAKMTIQCGLTVLLFESGSQENEIHVFCVNGQAQYHIKTAGWGPYMLRGLNRDVVSTVTGVIDYIPTGPVLGGMKKLMRT